MKDNARNMDAFLQVRAMLGATSMRVFKVTFLTVIYCALSIAADDPVSFVSAKKIWEQNSDRKDYQIYAKEFVQFNNALKLDEKNECYGLDGGPVELMLVIARRNSDQYAFIKEVFVSSDNQKSQCFKNTYIGIRIKTPPFFPFVFQMKFE